METLSLQHQQFLKKLNNQLFIILLLMVACFFTWSENVNITRAIKVVGRMGVMISSILLYRKIIRYGSINSLEYKNIFSPILYIGYLILGFISFSWSTNPGFSALQWFMTAQSFVFSYFFVKSLKVLDVYFNGHNIRLYHLLGNAVFVLQLIFVIGMWVDPDVFFRLTDGGEEARLGGTMMNPNELGMLAGVGCACLIFDLYRFKNKVWTIVKILVIFYALFMTGSRSSLIGVLLIIFFHINQTKQKTLKFAIIALVAMVAPFAVYTVILKGGDQERLEEIMSLTGRLPFWQALITEGLPREPLLGFGFMRIDYKEFFQSAHTYPGKMTHNTFMQVLMNLGFIGFTIVLFQVFFTVKSILSEQKELKLMLIGILIPIVINSFTEFGIFGESNYGILFYQIIIFSIAFRNNNHLTRLQKIILKKKRPDLIQD
ncbi:MULTISPECIES: O-antigen ligase family protein [Chryseobacterium]|uniref:Lipid A core - O-antigen ligase and related enzymes n=1 Tax=Chryseobacterium taihuense TaxID=1141221 RepID=A0A4V6IDF4_9FLAO|nr:MULTISPECIES: O-antigen ligase family protein [Chryseobacterium]QQV03418.1 O-antigen ligase family protein [Chryseobacterium sp. FDAARGOS 1104]VFB03264.1 Lipid A core - O-antigen ligase and related enzymes [Chryseobacterium taihuense]